MKTIAKAVASAAGALLAACASAPIPTTIKPSEPQYIYYSCQGSITKKNGFFGYLQLGEQIREDGTVLSKSVNWTYHYSPQSAANASAGSGESQMHITMTWPSDNLFGAAKAFDWSQGGIEVSYFDRSANANRYGRDRKEPWRRVILDRNGSLTVREDKSGRFLFLSGLDMNMTGELGPPSSPSGLRVSLDKLLAYGSGAESLTVYETAVTRPAGNGSPASGMHRILASYDLDLALVQQAVSWIQEQEALWRQSIGDYRATCERVEYFGEDVIIVTDAATKE